MSGVLHYVQRSIKKMRNSANFHAAYSDNNIFKSSKTASQATWHENHEIAYD